MHIRDAFQMLHILICIWMINPSGLTKQRCIGHGDKDCIIDCNVQHCQHKLINATNHESLYISCISTPTESMCDGSKILCPNDGLCTLNCTADHSCNNIHIISHSHSSHLSLHCGPYSCFNITVNASDINTVEMNAIGYIALSESHIYVENVSIFSLNCVERDACLQNNLYLPSRDSDDEERVNINCFGESCRGSSIHVEHGMDNIGINIVSNCECSSDITECENYWYIFCEEYYDSESMMGYVTFRDYECLKTENISKCECDVMQQYVLDHFENDDGGCDGDDMEYIHNVTVTMDEEQQNGDWWSEVMEQMENKQTLIWMVLGSMVFIVLLIMCYLCAIKMKQYNHNIQLLREFDSDSEGNP